MNDLKNQKQLPCKLRFFLIDPENKKTLNQNFILTESGKNFIPLCVRFKK